MSEIELAYSSRTYFQNDIFVTEHSPLQTPKGVFVLLHGFPAWVSKNYDIGEQLVLSGYKVYIPHHRGLGQSPGRFRFNECLRETRQFINHIKKSNSNLKLSLMGHSWGGYLALSHLDLIDTNLILLAPLAQFPKEEVRQKKLVSDLYLTNRNDLGEYSLESLEEEFRYLERALDLSILKDPGVAPRSILFYGTRDEVIPPDLISNFAQEVASETFETIVSDDDHRLSKRRPVLQKIANWLEFTD